MSGGHAFGGSLNACLGLELPGDDMTQLVEDLGAVLAHRQSLSLDPTHLGCQIRALTQRLSTGSTSNQGPQSPRHHPDRSAMLTGSC